jgi:hypothetical protein
MPEKELSKSSPTAWFKYTDSYDFMERVRTGMPPLIICAACNGGIQAKRRMSSSLKPRTKSLNRYKVHMKPAPPWCISMRAIQSS